MAGNVNTSHGIRIGRIGRMRRSPRLGHRSIRGQSMVEFIIIAPLLFFMILVIVQLVMLYRIKATLDYATLMAARAGAIHGADMGKMKDGLARGLTPLYTHGKTLTELEMGYGRAWGEVRNPLGFVKIDVISPTRAAWSDHRERQYNGREAIPNDSLAFRSTVVKGSGVNVQDANILKIRVTYQARIVVPFVEWVMRGRSDFLEAGTFEETPLSRLTGRLPIESSAIVRMQSPIYERNNLAR